MQRPTQLAIVASFNDADVKSNDVSKGNNVAKQSLLLNDTIAHP
jgi:hypothetical protein